MKRSTSFFLVALVAALSAVSTGDLQAQERDKKVRADRSAFGENPFWLYNDLEAGFAKARRTGKPLLVVLRCVP